jgi:multidrug efflux pump subunit AcrA (membrane-fusion protein)
VLLTLVVAGGIATWLAFRPAPKATTTAATRTVVVSQGPVERLLRVSGSTSARSYVNITAPMMRAGESRSSMVILNMAPSGKIIKKGDVVLEIDPGWLQDHIDDIEDQVRAAKNDVEKRRAEQAVEWENLQQTLRNTKAAADKARLDYKAAEVRSTVDRELLKLSLDQAEAQLKQRERDLAERKLAHAAEIKILEITQERHQRHHDRHKNDLNRFKVVAPMTGLVVIAPVFRGGEMTQLAVGDQVFPGQPAMKIVEPNSMQVEASINQTETTDLRIGQKVRIGFEAYPKLKLPGKVYSVGALAVGGWRQQNFIRTVPVKIAFEQLDPQVIPDLSAFGEVVIESEDNVVKVPRPAVSFEGDKAFVYVKSQNGFEKRAVEAGLVGNLDVEIESGLKPGETIRVEN